MPKKNIDRRIDLKGKVCPYTALETRLALKDMAAGEVLEIITDFYPTRQTIPDLAENLGYPCELIDGEKPVLRFIIHKTYWPRRESGHGYNCCHFIQLYQ